MNLSTEKKIMDLEKVASDNKHRILPLSVYARSFYRIISLLEEKKNSLFHKKLFLKKSNFRFTAKLRGRYRDFPYTPLSSHWIAFCISISLTTE